MSHSPGRRPRPSPRSGRGRTALAAVSVAAALIALGPSSAVGRITASGRGDSRGPRALGIGDPLYPNLGNPGYDVSAYDLAFDYRRANRPLGAVTTISARATTSLPTINLDFAEGRVRSVRVNGAPARFTTADEDLVITPTEPIGADDAFEVTVRHTSDPRDTANGGWVRTRDGLAMANQADAAHRVFPCNDHPSDKARFTIRVTAPRDLTVVAGGLPLERVRKGARTTWAYRLAHPMATELAQVSIGRSAVLRRTGPHGLPVRDVVPAADRKRMEPWLARTPGQLAWMERKAGPYPFETYGLLIAGASTGFELETQTLSLFERGLFTGHGLPRWYLESIMVHELAHQWFGDSVAPRRWSDLWLNEGHATWYEALYADERGKASLERRMREAYRQSDGWRAAGGPPAAPRPAEPGQQIGIFRPVVYDGSALVLYALRQHIGREAFERLERQWVIRHRDGVASTSDFTRLASEVAGRDVAGFLNPWLYGTKTPPMPGRPTWKAAPRTGTGTGTDAKAGRKVRTGPGTGAGAAGGTGVGDGVGRGHGGAAPRVRP
ncbi:M1 family metallopeptidase [Streptomyces sp. NEAU-Y11]|uniref:M1 family metallopeptidase n=1 Tax=Streptomyces cucumeris TaxID=2962890 RepID=UPI0020C8420E|nr:M1 family metallopeptidase [Streptomyces sp. NEAU-Y11]MCP9205591.1 M1 family metallopeptidase [Streptomyces sp. NEAU-Y11]